MSLFLSKPFVGISNFCFAVSERHAVFIDTHEYHFVDSKDHLLCNLISYLAGKCKRGAAEASGLDTKFNNIALFRRADKVDFGHVLGNAVIGTKLDNRIDSRFFIDPTEKTTTEKRTVRIQVFGFHPFTCVKIHSRYIGAPFKKLQYRE